MSFREFHFRWDFEFNATQEQLWPLVADTNRFNRDTGVPPLEIDDSQSHTRNARRRLRLSIYGMPVEWEEQPFEWIRPSRFGVERIYSKGPMSRMRVLAELTATGDRRTSLKYQVWATPRNLLGVIAIPLQIRLLTAPRFRAAFRRYGKLAADRPDSASPVTAQPFSPVEDQRLNALKQKILGSLTAGNRDAATRIVERLTDFLKSADDFTVARFRPYQLADEWGESRRTVLEVCLLATRAGVLDLQWDLLCPLCRGPSESSSSLRDVDPSVHCDTCKIDFTVNLDRFVELTFRPNPAVRRVEVSDYCVGSPVLTPHVVAQQLLKGNESRTLTMPLEKGNYRLRALELPGSLSVIVSSGGDATSRAVAHEHGWETEDLNVSERPELQLVNDTPMEQLVILERTAWSDQSTTAAEVTALQIFRDLFSSEALRPGERISVGTLTVLFTDLKNSTRMYREIGDATAFGRVMNHFDILRNAIAEHDGAIVKTIGDAVMAVFRRPVAALIAISEAQKTLANPAEGGMPLLLKAGVHTGPCIAVTLNDRLDYFGSTVNLAARLEGLSTGSDVIVSRTMYDDPEFEELLASGKFRATSFEMAVKGFEEECFELWRISS